MRPIEAFGGTVTCQPAVGGIVATIGAVELPDAVAVVTDAGLSVNRILTSLPAELHPARHTTVAANTATIDRHVTDETVAADDIESVAAIA